MRCLLVSLIIATLGSAAAAQDETPLVRFSILPGVRADDRQLTETDSNGGSATFLLSLSYAGSEPLRDCWIADETWEVPPPTYPPLYPFGDIAMTHHEMDETGTLTGEHDAMFDLAPGQTRYFVVRAGSSDCQYSTSCFGRPELRCLDPEGAGGRHDPLRFRSRGLSVERLQLNVRATPYADVIPIMVTPSGDGFLRIEEPGGVAAAAIAAVNIGLGQTVRVVATSSGGMVADICRTDELGQCLTDRSAILDVEMPNGEPVLFAVRVRDGTDYSASRAPARNRVYVRFLAEKVRQFDSFWLMVGDTSVAIDEPQGRSEGDGIAGVWRLSRCTTEPRYLGDIRTGDLTQSNRLVISSDGLAMSIPRLFNGPTVCRDNPVMQVLEFDSGSVATGATVHGLRVAQAERFPIGWTSYAETRRLDVAVSRRSDGETLDLTGTISSYLPNYPEPYDEEEFFAQREPNASFDRGIAGTYEVSLRYGTLDYVARFNIDADLRITSVSSNSCAVSGQLARLADPTGVSGAFDGDLTLANCQGSLRPFNGDLRALLVTEAVNSDLHLSGGAYRRTSSNTPQFLPFLATRVED